MSKFKRSFLSPHNFYKSFYTNASFSDSPASTESKNKSSSASSSLSSPVSVSVSSLQLCRGSSVACDNVEVPKENHKPSSVKSSNIQAAANSTIIISKKSCNSASVSVSNNTDNSLNTGVPKYPAGVSIENAGNSMANKFSDGSKLQQLVMTSRQPLQPISENVSINALKPPKPIMKKEAKVDKQSRDKPKPTPNQNPVRNVWDVDANCDAGPVSSWSALGNRYLLSRPLPLDVGRCACYIVHEREAGADSPIVYSLYTDEGHGRPDRKLAVARHRRRSGRSEFVIAQNGAGTLLTKREDGFLGRVTGNIVGSRYCVWDEASSTERKFQGGRQLVGVVIFEPTVTTLTGTFKAMRAFVPKYQSLHLTNSNQTYEPAGLGKDWEESISKAHELCSRKPYYNRVLRRYELDYRDRIRPGYKVQTSSKNFQLIMEEHGKQVILLHGKVANSKYIMEYRFPLTAYQAFGICLASIDSKLCCSV